MPNVLLYLTLPGKKPQVIASVQVKRSPVTPAYVTAFVLAQLHRLISVHAESSLPDDGASYAVVDAFTSDGELFEYTGNVMVVVYTGFEVNKSWAHAYTDDDAAKGKKYLIGVLEATVDTEPSVTLRGLTSGRIDELNRRYSGMWLN